MVSGTNLDVVQEPRIRVKYAGRESVNVRTKLQKVLPEYTYYTLRNVCIRGPVSLTEYCYTIKLSDV